MISLVVLASLIGACLGSFVTTAALRSTRQEQAIFGRSSCDHCGAGLSYFQSVPVLSFAWLGGACGRCGGKIDPIHLVGEVAGAGIVMLSCLISSPIRAVGVATLGLILLASAVVDAKTQRLPNALTLIATALCAALAATDSRARLVEGLIAASLAFIVLEAVRRGHLHFRGRSGLGFGDVKLMTVLGLWLGVKTPWVIALAASLGLIAMALVRPVNGRLAFGPALALAGWTLGVVREMQLWPGLA